MQITRLIDVYPIVNIKFNYAAGCKRKRRSVDLSAHAYAYAVWLATPHACEQGLRQCTGVM